MASLPRKGDRVRVTDAHVMANIIAGSEVILTQDAKPSLFVGGCEFVCRFPGHCNEHQSGPVKVEILERAGAKALREVKESIERIAPTSVYQAKQDAAAEFARGMRRAVEIAEKLLDTGMLGKVLVIRLKEAVEKEIEK